MINPEPNLSITDQQIQLVLQGLIDHLIQTKDSSSEILLSGKAGDQHIQIEINKNNIQILVCHKVNKALYALVRFDKNTREFGLHHNISLIKKSVVDLILLEGMNVI